MQTFSIKKMTIACSILLAVMALSLLLISAVQAETPKTAGSIDTPNPLFTSPSPGPAAFIQGWVASETYPNERLIVVVTTEPEFNYDEVIAYFLPTLVRQDVKELYGLDSDFKTGFTWVIPKKYHDGVDHTFYFWSAFQFPSPDPYLIGSSTLNAIDAGTRGSLDIVDGNRIAGWAADYDYQINEDPSVAIVTYINGQHTGSNVANQNRPDVRDALGLREGNFGYNFSLDWPIGYSPANGDILEIYAISFTEKKMVLIASAKSQIESGGGVYWINESSGEMYW